MTCTTKHLHGAGQGAPHPHLRHLPHEGGREHGEGPGEAGEEAAQVDDGHGGGEGEQEPAEGDGQAEEHHGDLGQGHHGDLGQGR